MTWLLSLPSRIKAALVALLGAVVALGATYLAGKREGRQRAAQKAAEHYANTRKRIDEADKPSDPDAARKWLRDRERQRDL